MTNIKKIGLTALAGSLAATSAFAGALDVTGTAKITYVSQDETEVTGNPYSMSQGIGFSGSGELDNGMNVALSFVLDQGDNATAAGGPFDSHSIKISSDALGTITIAGEGAGNAQSALDTTAAGDIWDNGFTYAARRSKKN